MLETKGFGGKFGFLATDLNVLVSYVHISDTISHLFYWPGLDFQQLLFAIIVLVTDIQQFIIDN